MERKLLQFPRGSLRVSPLSWSPDGRFLAFSGTEDATAPSIWIVSTESGEHHRASAPPKGYYWDFSPAFSPDGRTLAFVRARDTYSRAVILQDMNRDGSTRGRLREATGYDRAFEDLIWQADGRGLILTAAASGALWPVAPVFGGRAGACKHRQRDGEWPSVSRTGRLAYEKRHTD